jgi:hypothetical protein
MRAVALVLFLATSAAASAAPPPPPVPVPRREPRPPYEAPEGAAEAAPTPSPTPAPAEAPAPAETSAPGAEEVPSAAEPEEYTRSGIGLGVEVSLGDCTGETCANHESGIGFGLGAEALYRFDLGIAIGLGYWAQGVSSDPGSSFEAWDPCQPLADGVRDDECNATWKTSILRYRLWGVVARWYPLASDVLDPFVGVVGGAGWFQLFGRFDVERAGTVERQDMSYTLTGFTTAFEAGTDLYVAKPFAIGGLFRWTVFWWSTACMDGDLGMRALSRLGLSRTCTSPANLDGTGMTEAGSPNALQFMLRARYTL